MKTKLTLLLLAIAIAGVIAIPLTTPDAVQQPTAVAPVAEAAASRVAQAESAQLKALENTGPGQLETEIVMGVEVRKDRGCSVQRHYVDLGNGTVTDAYSCVPDEPVVDDYDHYSNQELRVLSYSDAKAAAILGKRLVEVDLAESRRLLLRAVALKPANLDPVMWLAAQAYSLRGRSPAAQNARANTYVLARTAQALGSDANIAWVLEDLDQAGFDNDEIARLEDQVTENLRRIHEIQLEVHGESVVDEVLL
ncbi:MAG: hypothetical protein ACR2QR_07790 [Woeseiaceae bacterium]